jgi:membrane protease YdiL (CAAX protease family)
MALVCAVQLVIRVDPSSLSRATLYKAGAASGLLFGGLPLLTWCLTGRPFDSFGGGWLGPPLPVLAAALAWTILLCAALLAVRRGVLRGPLVRLYDRYTYIMPRSRRELAASWATSVLAGAGEEIAFRGFLLSYCVGLAGLPAGLLVSSLLFGAAHSYQRAFGMVFATAAGVLLGGAYLVSGSLLLVMWMHASWNMASFAAGYAP